MISEIKTLPVPEKLQLVEDLWDSMASDQESLPDHPAVIEEIRRRRLRFDANPDSGMTWDEMKNRIRDKRA